MSPDRICPSRSMRGPVAAPPSLLEERLHVPVHGIGSVELVSGTRELGDMIEAWARFIYNHAPGVVFGACMGEDGGYIDTLRDRMIEFAREDRGNL